MSSSQAPKSPVGVGYDAFPSLASGINGLKDLETSLNRIVNEASSHTSSSNSIYNSRFQFFNNKRASTNPDPSTDVAQREDSLVKAWKTVSEIDALLGSDFRPSMATHEEEQLSVDDTYVRRLNNELEAALHVSLTFKEKLRDSVRSSRAMSVVHSNASSAKSVDSTAQGHETYSPEVEVPLSRAVFVRHLDPGSTSSSQAALRRSASASRATHSTLDVALPNPPSPPRATGLLSTISGPAPSPLSLQAGSSIATASTAGGGAAGAGSALLVSSSSVAAAAAAAAAASAAAVPVGLPPPAPGIGRKLPVIQLAVGSQLDHGEWTSDGGWKPADPLNDVYVPPHLQQIKPDDLVKIRELGRGCFGSVWLCKWRGVEVALKELLNQGATDCPPNEVFLEAERLASLRHPCIIAFYGIVNSPGSYATVVEYLRMGSLKSGLTRLRKQGADISRRLRCAIALQAARGMEYLHAQYVVHFDLKCDNLLCDLRDPQRPVVKIGDLGLSKKKKDSFVSGNMRGTLPWMAPELFPSVRDKDKEASNGTGAEDRVNEKVDIFSFGIVMWEIWSIGEQPYQNLGLADIFAGVMTGSLRPAIAPDCDPEWSAIMQACWHANPRSRPGFSEVADRLYTLQERLAAAEAAQGLGSGIMLGSGSASTRF